MQHPKNVKIVSGLQFNVAQLLKEVTGATRSYNLKSTAIGRLDPGECLVAPLVGRVEFLRTGPDILVTGTVETTIEKNCGRCLNIFSTPVTIEIEEVFYPTLDLITGKRLPLTADADEANLINEQHTLDLSEVVRQALLLESEGFRYCKLNCKGLCPYCGQDRNINPCICRNETIDQRWAGLRAIQIED